MMAYPLRLNEKAQDEFSDAYFLYSMIRTNLADKFMLCVEKRLLQISEYPERYAKKHGNYRQVKVANFPYYIVYEFFKRKQFIHIAAIYHGKRNPKKKYRRLR